MRALSVNEVSGVPHGPVESSARVGMSLFVYYYILYASLYAFLYA